MTFKSRYQKRKAVQQLPTELERIYKAITSTGKERTMPKKLKDHLNDIKNIFKNEPLAEGVIAYDQDKGTWFYEDQTVYQECSRLWAAENLAMKRIGMGFTKKVDQFYQNNGYRKTRTVADLTTQDRIYFSDLVNKELQNLRDQLQKAKDEHVKTIKTMKTFRDKAHKWDKLQELFS